MAAQAPPSTLALAIGFTIVGGITGFFLGQANSIGVFSSSKTRSRKGKRKPAVGGDVDLTDKPVKSAEAKTSEIDADGARDESDGSGESGSGSEVEEGSDEDFDGELKAFEDVKGECKMTLVVRTDLQMGKGKIAAQCSHATLANFTTLQAQPHTLSLLRRWQMPGQAKVALKVDSEDEMLLLQAKAVSLGVCAKVIRDAGRTQIESGTATCLGVGPAPKPVIDEITGGLRLL